MQASELRSKLVCGHYDASKTLSPSTRALYEAVYAVIGQKPSQDKALIWNDYEQEIDQYLARIVADLKVDGKLIDAITPVKVLLA